VTEGESLVAEGESLVAEGESLVAEGESLVAEGEGLVLEGESLVQDRENPSSVSSEGVETYRAQPRARSTPTQGNRAGAALARP
jgi:hypothetical protein